MTAKEMHDKAVHWKGNTLEVVGLPIELLQVIKDLEERVRELERKHDAKFTVDVSGISKPPVPFVPGDLCMPSGHNLPDARPTTDEK